MPPNERLVLTVRRASRCSARRPAAHPQGVRRAGIVGGRTISLEGARSTLDAMLARAQGVFNERPPP
jgi:hypothetical protein